MTEIADRLAHTDGPGSPSRAGPVPWDLVLAGLGLAALYIPTYLDLARGPWTDPHEAHGPFMLAIVAGAIVARREVLFSGAVGARFAGLAALVFGLVLYVIGRSQEFTVFETMSQIPVLAGTILTLRGWAGLRRLWFPVVFLAFTIIWPGWVIDALTVPLKQMATELTVSTLRDYGYAIASTGVIIQIGKYQLLVADACSGLNSLISLLSVGVLYLYMVQRPSLAHNLAIIVAMPFIAFFANVLRIITLALLTYHFGNEVGQGFFHSFTGLFLFGVSLVGVFVLDGFFAFAARIVRALRKKGGGS